MNKNWLIAGSLIGAGIIALFIKNVYEANNYKLISRQDLLEILKRLKKENDGTLRKIAIVVTQLQTQIGTTTTQMVQQFLQSPQSPIKVQQHLDNNIEKVIVQFGITMNDFNMNLNNYKDDKQVKKMRDQLSQSLRAAMSGNPPQINVVVPETLTRERVLEIINKVTRQKYLLQVDKFRKIMGKSEQEIKDNPRIFDQLPKMEDEEAAILESQGIAQGDQSPSLVFRAAINKYIADSKFKTQITQIENNYLQIMKKYTPKMNKRTITEEQIQELEDQILYFDSI